MTDYRAFLIPPEVLARCDAGVDLEQAIREDAAQLDAQARIAANNEEIYLRAVHQWFAQKEPR